MNSKTFLFFATEVGLAHIVRSLAIAEELHKRKHTVIFAIPKRKWFFLKSTPVKIVDVLPYVDHETIKIIKVAKNKPYLRKLIKNELALIRKYNPDVVVVDTRISALFAATIENKKAVIFGGSNSVPGFSYISPSLLPSFLNSIIQPFSEHLIRFIHKAFLKNLIEITKEYNPAITFNRIIYRPTYIIPESESYFPKNNTAVSRFYVNPPSWNGFTTMNPDWLKKINPNRKTIYLTFGGTGFDGNKLIRLSEKLVESGYRVIVSTGNLIKTELFPKHSNLFVATFLPGKEVCKRVDLVICHGGYGTLMDAIRAGKPVISIPFNPDQMVQGNRIAELKLGEVLQHIKLMDIINIFKLDWDKFQNVNSRVSVGEIVDTVKKVLSNYTDYINSITIFNKRFHKIDGATESADIIERLI